MSDNREQKHMPQNRDKTRRQKLQQNIMLFVLFLLFGIILINHVKSVGVDRATLDLTVRYRQRQEDLRRYEERYQKLLEDNRLLNEQKDQAIADLLSRQGMEDILEELMFNRALAGFTEVRGPGVTVRLDDKPGYNFLIDSEDSIVHDTDISHVLDLLRNAGAGAFAVNNTRIVNVSYVKCIGSTIRCIQERLMPPYIIVALGDPDSLAAAISEDQMFNIRKTQGIGLIVEVKKEEEVVIPPFSEAGDITKYIDRLDVVAP